jgi:3',5'-cyclic AMP phosphodiesterase CpdA
MKKIKRFSLKIISCVIALTMILSIIPFSSSAVDSIRKALTPDKTLNFATLSDIHYYPKELTDNYCEEFIKYAKSGIGREPYQSVGILESALAALEVHAKANGMKYVIIPGDLTSNGEYVAHVQLAKRLEQFEKDSGLQVLVIDGNHDIYNYKSATTFESGTEDYARATTPDEFKEIYKNLGYDLAYHTYTPSSGEANKLSYSVKLDGYRLIFMDLTKYSADVTASGKNGAETGGKFSDEFLKWVLNEIADAKANGETVIGINHQNLVPHYTSEYTILRGFVVDDFEEITEQLADAGMHFALTGHLHFNEISETVSDDGERIHEVNTDSLTAFPNYFREFTMTTDSNGKSVMNVNSFDVDCVKPVTVNGYTYPTPFRVESLKDSFYDENGISGLAGNLIDGTVDEYAAKFAEKGIMQTLKDDFGIDLEKTISGYFGKGLVIGNVELFTTKNLMSFIEDLFSQIEKKYMTDPKSTEAFLKSEVDKILNVQVSNLPNSRFYEEYGVGSTTKPGTFQDMIEDVIIYMYEGQYDVHDDAFMMDAVNNFENGDVIFKLFDTAVDVLANDILQDKLLTDLDFNISALFPDGSAGHCLGTVLGVVFKVAFLGDTSYLNISNKVLTAANKLGVVDYSSLWGIVEHYMDEYLTDTQLEGVGQTLGGYILDLSLASSSHDSFSATLVYDGKVPVEATRDNYRIPTTLSVTFGENQSARNISWYTKPSVSGTDIEIIEYTDNPVFSGTNTAPVNAVIKKTTEKTTRQFPGVDFGVAGLMTYKFPMNRHIISVSGLEAGKKYLYRVGDASRGWWSQTGTFEIADGGNETTFVHVSDPQSQTAKQYETFDSVISKAYSMYSDSDFILNTGDCVDHGDNFNQWKWFLDGASDTLMNTVMMAASGNHEGKGSYATVTNFSYSNVPEQETKSGVYFSFDYNNVHVAVLNTNNLDSDNSLNDAQVDWLIDDMQASKADWKFVAIHKAAYSDGSHYKDKDVCKIRQQLSTLMPQLGIDMVFQGHDHVYLRTNAMINNKVESVTTSTASFNGKNYTVKNSPIGTVYVISGCSGVKVYKQKDASLTDKYFPRAEVVYDAEYPVFSGVRIVGNTLYFDAYTVNAQSGDTQNIDSFAIQKDLSVKKGTGVPNTIDWAALFTQVINVVVPILKTIIDQVLNFLQSKVY